jgi:hypothetical protein
MLASFTWSIVPRAGAAAVAVALSVLAASAEGSYALYDVLARGRELDSLRQLNIDAITAWVFGSLTVDGLPRSLWYTPQHAMACALGLVACLLPEARAAMGHCAPPPGGSALGGALAVSPFSAAFSLIYATSCSGGGGWRKPARLGTRGCGTGHAALAWQGNLTSKARRRAMGYSGPITRALPSCRSSPRPLLWPRRGPAVRPVTAAASWPRRSGRDRAILCTFSRCPGPTS